MNLQRESYLMAYYRQMKMAEMTQNQNICGSTNDNTASRRLNHWFDFLEKLKNMRIQVTFDPPESNESKPVIDALIL